MKRIIPLLLLLALLLCACGGGDTTTKPQETTAPTTAAPATTAPAENQLLSGAWRFINDVGHGALVSLELRFSADSATYFQRTWQSTKRMSEETKQELLGHGYYYDQYEGVEYLVAPSASFLMRYTVSGDTVTVTLNDALAEGAEGTMVLRLTEDTMTVLESTGVFDMGGMEIVFTCRDEAHDHEFVELEGLKFCKFCGKRE